MTLSDAILVAILLVTGTGLYQIIGLLDSLKVQNNISRDEIKSVREEIRGIANQIASQDERASKNTNRICIEIQNFIGLEFSTLSNSVDRGVRFLTQEVQRMSDQSSQDSDPLIAERHKELKDLLHVVNYELGSINKSVNSLIGIIIDRSEPHS